MKKILPILLFTSFLLADTKIVAISYFDNTSGLEKYNPLSKGLADMLITDLSNVKSIQIVEREKLESLLKEIDLGEGKFIDPNTAQKLGRGLGAEYILTGAFLSIDPMMRIDARIMEVATGKIIGAEEVTGQSNNFFDLEKKLAELLIKHLNIKASLTKPVKKDIDIDAILNYSEAIDLDDKGFKEEATNILQQTIDDFPEFSLAQEKLDQIKKLINKLEEDRGIQIEKLTREILSTADPNSESFPADIHKLFGTYLTAWDYSKIYALNRYLDSVGDDIMSKDIYNNSLGAWSNYYDVFYFSTMKKKTQLIEAATNFLTNHPTSMYFSTVKSMLETAIQDEEEYQKNRKSAEKDIPVINYYTDMTTLGEIIYNWKKVGDLKLYTWSKMALHERIIPMYEKIEYGHSKRKEDRYNEDWKIYQKSPFSNHYRNFYKMLEAYITGAFIYNDDEEIRWILKYLEEQADIAFDKDDFDALDAIEATEKSIKNTEKYFEDHLDEIAVVPTYQEINLSLKQYTSLDEIYDIQKIWKSLNINTYSSLYTIDVQSCGIFLGNLNKLKGMDETYDETIKKELVADGQTLDKDSAEMSEEERKQYYNIIKEISVSYKRNRDGFIDLYDKIYRAQMLSTIQNGDYDSYRAHLKEYKSDPVIKSMKDFRRKYAELKKTNEEVIDETEVIKNILKNRDYLLLSNKSYYFRDAKLYDEEVTTLLKILKYDNIEIAERDEYYYWLFFAFQNLGKFDQSRNIYEQWNAEMSLYDESNTPYLNIAHTMINFLPK
jgi:TolB-like protein